MKELILALISFTLGYFTSITDVHAQTQFFYGPNGNGAGTAFQSGAPVMPIYVVPIQPVTPMFNYTPIR